MQDFLKPTRDDWLKRAPNAGHALQGRSDGPRAFRKAHAPWRIMARMDHPDVHYAAQQARDDLDNGADGLILTSARLVPALADLSLHKFAIFNDAGENGAEALATLIKSKPLDPARLTIDFATSNIAHVKKLVADGFTGPFMHADGRVGHAHGLTDAQELGVTLALAKARLVQLGFLPAAQQSSAVSITLSAAQNIFPTLAKFRAARILWKHLLADLKLPDSPLALNAETSRMMMADVDAHTNILRTTTAAFAAGLGGADFISVLPFSYAQGTPNSFARRVARNVQLLLLHESHLWRVDDPAGGAGHVETLTQAMCDEALAVMRKAETGDWPTGEIDKSQARPVIGVSKYKNATEAKPEIDDPKAPLPPSGYSPNKLGESHPRVLPQLVGEVPEGRWGPWGLRFRFLFCESFDISKRRLQVMPGIDRSCPRASCQFRLFASPPALHRTWLGSVFQYGLHHLPDHQRAKDGTRAVARAGHCGPRGGRNCWAYLGHMKKAVH